MTVRDNERGDIRNDGRGLSYRQEGVTIARDAKKGQSAAKVAANALGPQSQDDADTKMWTMRWAQIELSTGREGVSVYHTQRGTKATNLDLQQRGLGRNLQQWKRARPDYHSEWSK
jgi:hypothetical protein